MPVDPRTMLAMRVLTLKKRAQSLPGGRALASKIGKCALTFQGNQDMSDEEEKEVKENHKELDKFEAQITKAEKG